MQSEAHRWTFLAVLLVMCVVLGCHPRSLQAQGTMQQLPDPMGSKQLLRLIDRHLDPTPEQWLLVDELHATYLERFKALREGPIETFLSESNRMMMSASMPDRKTFDRFMQKLDRVESRIRSVDDELFEAIIPLLSEEEVPELLRARQARERIRLMSGSARNMGTSPPARDLWSTIDSAGLDDMQLDLVDEVMRDYEAGITVLLRKWHDGSVGTMGIVLDELEARGFGGVEFDPLDVDDELMRRMMEAVEAANRTAMERNFDHCRRARDLTQRKLLELCALLDRTSARRLKLTYVASGLFQGFSSVVGEEFDPPRGPDLPGDIERVLEDGGLPSEVRNEIEPLLMAELNAYLVSDHAILDDLCRIIRQYDPMEAMVDFDSMVMGEGEEEPSATALLSNRFDALREDRIALDRLHRSRILDLIRPLGFERINTIMEQGPVDEGDAPDIAVEFIDGNLTLPGEGFNSLNRNWVIDPIDVPALARIRRLLGLDDSMEAVLAALHERYLEQWAEDVRGVLALVTAEDDESSETSQAHLARAMSSARSIDLAFFEELALTLPETSGVLVEALREERRCDHALLREWSVASKPALYERVNALRILLDADQDPEALEASLAVVSEAGSALVDALEALATRRFLGWHEGQRVRMRLFEAIEDGGVPREMSLQSLEEVTRTVNDGIPPLLAEVDAGAKLFEATLLESCGEARLETFTSRMREAAHPRIYRDASDLRPVFALVLRLDDLTDEQRERIESIEDDFGDSWGDLSRRMSRIDPFVSFVMTADMEAQRALHDSMNRYEQLDFQRQELAGRFLRKLARLLGEEQRARFRVFKGVLDGAG